MSPDDLAIGLRILADLMDAGLPMTRVLATFAELAPAGWSEALPPMRQSVREGCSMSAALQDAPGGIPPLVVGIIHAGEKGGDLAGAVRRAAQITEAGAETRAAMRAALAYPLVLAVAGTGAVALMVGVVIPRFALILADLGRALPPATQLVMTSAAAMRAAFVPGAIALGITIVATRAWIATDDGRAGWHELLLRLPFVGAVRASASAARTTFTLATLLETGVSLRQALALAARASGDASTARRVLGAGKRIESGQAIASALRDEHALTPLALRLVQAGEESGRLSAMLRHAAKLEQARSDRLVKGAVRLVEPAIILVFAGVVALVAAALLQAVYSVRPTW